MKIIEAVFFYHLMDYEWMAHRDIYHAHGQNEYELHFFLDGNGVFLCDKTRYTIGPERFFLVAPGKFHAIIPDKNPLPLTFYAIVFTCAAKDIELSRLLREIYEKKSQNIALGSLNRFACDEIIRLFCSKDATLIRCAEYLLLSFLIRIYHQGGVFNIDEDSTALKSSWEKKYNPQNAYVTKALYFMQKNVRKNLGADEISRFLSLSTEHFIRIFRTELKITPHKYLLYLKIEGASGLLVSTTKKIGEISDYFGFENQFHFSRCFKKYTGVSPLEYRKTYLQAANLSS